MPLEGVACVHSIKKILIESCFDILDIVGFGYLQDTTIGNRGNNCVFIKLEVVFNGAYDIKSFYLNTKVSI